jgi:hypothetical protein
MNLPYRRPNVNPKNLSRFDLGFLVTFLTIALATFAFDTR